MTPARGEGLGTGAERRVAGNQTMTRALVRWWKSSSMSIRNTQPMKRRPTHPGEMLREDFMPDYRLTVASLASAAGVSRQSVNELLRGRRAVSPEMSLRLALLFGNTPEFWLDAQRAVDLWDAAQAIKGEMVRIKPLRVA